MSNRKKIWRRMWLTEHELSDFSAYVWRELEKDGGKEKENKKKREGRGLVGRARDEDLNLKKGVQTAKCLKDFLKGHKRSMGDFFRKGGGTKKGKGEGK